jgi:chromosome segregation protein
LAAPVRYASRRLFALRAEPPPPIGHARKRWPLPTAARRRTRIGTAHARRLGRARAAQVDARRAAEHQGELERRRQRAEREVHDADALTERLSTRRDELVDQIARLDDESRTLAESLAVRGETAARAREQLTVAERAQEESREARTAAQVEQAQTQAGCRWRMIASDGW